jgi:hypothetical protein
MKNKNKYIMKNYILKYLYLILDINIIFSNISNISLCKFNTYL